MNDQTGRFGDDNYVLVKITNFYIYRFWAKRWG
jgi:hypothetical protein